MKRQAFIYALVIGAACLAGYIAIFFLFPSHISDYQEEYGSESPKNAAEHASATLEGLLTAKFREGENERLAVKSDGAAMDMIILPEAMILSENGTALRFDEIEILSVIRAEGTLEGDMFRASKITVVPISLGGYANEALGIELQYPAGWKADEKYRLLDKAYLRFLGHYGFFTVGALDLRAGWENLSGEELKKEFAQSGKGLAPDELSEMDYGKKPLPLSAAGRPSAYFSGQGSACLLIPYREPASVSLDEQEIELNHAVVCADQEHFNMIVQSLKLSGQTGSSADDGSGLKIGNVLEGSLVSSPLVIDGEAPGTWYFEGVFPVKIADANGKILGQSSAEAIGDWTTEGYVPFNAKISYSSPQTESGRLIFASADPAGLKANEKSLSIEIKFKAGAGGRPEDSAPATACIATGCSGEVCAPGETASACEFKEEFACLKYARCELQASGSCGWSETDEYKNCLAGLK